MIHLAECTHVFFTGICLCRICVDPTFRDYQLTKLHLCSSILRSLPHIWIFSSNVDCTRTFHFGCDWDGSLRMVSIQNPFWVWLAPQLEGSGILGVSVEKWIMYFFLNPWNGHEPLFVCVWGGEKLPLGFQLPQDFIIWFGNFGDFVGKVFGWIYVS